MWLPGKYFQMLHDLPRAALARYVRMTTGKPHCREVADVLNAALEASRLSTRYEPDAIRKAEERVDQAMADRLIQHWQENYGYSEISWSDPADVSPESPPFASTEPD